MIAALLLMRSGSTSFACGLALYIATAFHCYWPHRYRLYSYVATREYAGAPIDASAGRWKRSRALTPLPTSKTRQSAWLMAVVIAKCTMALVVDDEDGRPEALGGWGISHKALTWR